MAKQQACVAVIDDDRDILLAAELLLKRHFSKVLCYERPELLAEALKTETIDIFLLDMNFALGVNTGEEGLQWLQYILKVQSDAVVLLMTAYGDIETSVNAIKLGAADFILKPWQNEKLLATLNSAMLLAQSRLQVKVLKQHHNPTRKDIIADAPAMQQVMKLAQRAAATDVNVLVLGENGTGKEVIANEIHRLSPRAAELLVSVDLGAVPETLFESELFGHKKGAFTGAQADRAGRFQAANGGTLFLDEIGNLPLHLQAKLLRVLETREVTPLGADKSTVVDVRLICATNMPLQQLVDEGRFRADLFYRINTVQLELPALRERIVDIPLLLEFFIKKSAEKYRIPAKRLSPDALKQLCAYAWPGNVRELAHAVERALILSDDDILNVSDFLAQSRSYLDQTETKADFFERDDGLLSDCNLERVEKMAIEQAIKKHKGNISHAAQELGITRASLYRRIKKYEI
ncbi:sigma-54-dependent transcriptional regulator [Agaribacterium sp. ZY112]|uniref:sigma-54-dependent transcriptional regulator n=1 Tax=Agaribacterium sp. ZY112 TaxID=3233574 RepID=UPI0035237CE8